MSGRFAGFERHEVSGWPVLACRDERFKTFRTALLWRRPLDASQAARALLPALLQHGTAAYPDRPALARAREMAYGAHVGAALARHAESVLLSLQGDAVAGDFLPGRPDQLAAVLDLLGEQALRPRLVAGAAGSEFPAEVFGREQAQALAMVRAEFEDKAAFARQQAVQLACAGEPYGLPEHGGEAAIAALQAREPAAMLADFRERGERLCVVAGVLPQDLSDVLGPLLAELPGGSPAAVPPPVVPALRRPQRTRRTAVMQQAKVVLVLRAARPRDPAELCALQAGLALWGGGPQSRLFREVRERRSLCYYASAGGDPNKGLVLVQVGCESEAVDDVVAECLQQLQELQQGRFEDAELATTLATIEGSLRAIDDSLGGRLQFTVEQYLRGFDEDPAARRARFAAVGRDEVQQALRGVWLDRDYALVPGDDASGQSAEEGA